MPAIEIGVNRWRRFRRLKGAVEIGWFSVAWRLAGLVERLRQAEAELRASLKDGREDR